jgi:hypothetical protein
MAQQVQVTSKAAALQKLRTAYRTIYAVGILCLFLAGVVFVIMSQVEGGAIVAAVVAIFAALYIFLGYQVQRKSIVALTIFAIMMGLSIISGLFSMFQTGSPFGFLLPILALKGIEPAFSAIKELK